MKIIPLSCHFALSQASKGALYKVDTESGFICAWVRLLLLRRCTLKVIKPKNTMNRRSENKRFL